MLTILKNVFQGPYFIVYLFSYFQEKIFPLILQSTDHFAIITYPNDIHHCPTNNKIKIDILFSMKNQQLIIHHIIQNHFSWKMQTTFCQEFRLKKVIKWKAAKSNLGHFMTYTMYFLKSKKLRKLGVVRVAFKIDLIDTSIMLHLSKVSKVMFLCKTYFVLLNNPQSHP